MTRGKTFLLFSLLTLVLLTEIILFHWGPEAVFFITWLLLALTIQHESRLSAAVGLVFLAVCPLLLIAKNDALAEQAANYAYFFLAIGVTVQLEELLIERFSWLPRKMNFSYLWSAVIQSFRRCWGAVAAALGRGLAAADRIDLLRIVLVSGTTGLAAVVLWAVLNSAEAAIVLMLLVGAILFPFVVWGLWKAVRALEPAWLLRVLFAIVILPLIMIVMVWLCNLINKNNITRMEIAYNFITHLPDGKRTTPHPDGELIEAEKWTIEEIFQYVLFQHPAFSGASRIAYTVGVDEGNMLVFDVATAPESWQLPGDGVTFAVYIESDQSTNQLFSTYIDPKHNPNDRRWHPNIIDLSEYAGQTVTIIFETGSGPAGDYRNDWAGWGEPRLLAP